MKMLHVTIQTDQFEKEMEFYEKYVGLTLQADLRPKGKTWSSLEPMKKQHESRCFEIRMRRMLEMRICRLDFRQRMWKPSAKR